MSEVLELSPQPSTGGSEDGDSVIFDSDQLLHMFSDFWLWLPYEAFNKFGALSFQPRGLEARDAHSSD